MSSPSKLFSCVDAREILESPINNSTAKNHWSFAKDVRFKINKYYCDSFYNIPGLEKNDKRKAGFGYGKKTDLEYGKNPEHIVPSPDTYNLDSFVEINKSHGKGFTPLFSRNEIAPVSYIQIEPMKVPGPGRYDELRMNSSPKWSMRPKVDENLYPKTTVEIVPAPGTHEFTERINKEGRYYLSNHLSSRSKVFNPARSRRFNKSTTDMPGVGTYQPQNELVGNGHYVLSQNVSDGKRTFLDGRRLSFTEIKAKNSFTPGPGSYRRPSEFGHYDSKDIRLRGSQSQSINRDKHTPGLTDRTKDI